ncbi:hypothetical protein [Chitinophaga ginsengisegetis]|uniref:hypothetical protein n=1 Tax=Chitinophaga ginsengisegetis TaxID=393003 RepID=UPI000DC02D71|nr:hypothetical protein [Chitinophaga ginsengisegetis]MDR6567514.1 hypothetical protein [Chitinophaga ginsengisegetis]MDR6647931.1 hypothetical protein [Chitinophaga ginsengisegetis]MDR6654281.1 hypothetical protein [Chitinophaga ginsengisegetis]
MTLTKQGLQQNMKVKIFCTVLLLFGVMAQAQEGKTYTALVNDLRSKNKDGGKIRSEYYMLNFKKDEVLILPYTIVTEQGNHKYNTRASHNGNWMHGTWYQSDGSIYVYGLPDEENDVAAILKKEGNNLVSVHGRKIVFRPQQLSPDSLTGKTYERYLYPDNYAFLRFDKDGVKMGYRGHDGVKDSAGTDIRANNTGRWTRHARVAFESNPHNKYKWTTDGQYIFVFGFNNWTMAMVKDDKVVVLHDGIEIEMHPIE